jgi:hypothetical protein
MPRPYDATIAERQNSDGDHDGCVVGVRWEPAPVGWLVQNCCLFVQYVVDSFHAFPA